MHSVAGSHGLLFSSWVVMINQGGALQQTAEEKKIAQGKKNAAILLQLVRACVRISCVPHETAESYFLLSPPPSNVITDIASSPQRGTLVEEKLGAPSSWV